MELKFRLLCFVLLYNTEAFEARKSKTEERLEAIEYLVRGELYLVREKIETDKEERQRFMKKLEEILENLNMSAADISEKTTHSQAFKREENKGSIQGLSEILLHTRRGVMEEKKARKSDTNALVAQLKRLENYQSDTKLTVNALSSQLRKVAKDQSGIITNQGNLIKNQRKIIDNQNAIIRELTVK